MCRKQRTARSVLVLFLVCGFGAMAYGAEATKQATGVPAVKSDRPVDGAQATFYFGAAEMTDPWSGMALTGRVAAFHPERSDSWGATEQGAMLGTVDVPDQGGFFTDYLIVIVAIAVLGFILPKPSRW